jgi:hypothetical protein
MEEVKTEIKHSKPDYLKWIIIGVIGFIILILVFGLGVQVGAGRARFSYQWTQSYHKNFAGPRNGFLDDWQNFPAGDMMRGHGIFGKIIKLDSGSIVIQGQDNAETVVLITKDTVIEKLQANITLDQLKVDDYVVVIGSPNASGQIEAKLIRVLPSPVALCPNCANL